jgi:hypothetical protein
MKEILITEIPELPSQIKRYRHFVEMKKQNFKDLNYEV